MVSSWTQRTYSEEHPQFVKQWIISVKMTLQIEMGTGKMAQQVKLVTAKPEDLSLIPATCMVERTDLCSDLHMRATA